MIVTYDVSDVVCRTEGCENEGVTLSVNRRPGGRVVCGVCVSDIAEITKTGEIEMDEEWTSM